MPINQNSFWPYSQQTQPMQPMVQTQGPYNGIIQVADENEAIQRCNLLPPNSVSHPFFLPDGQTYVVVFKDGNNGVTTRRYRYEDVTPDPMAAYVTREDFAAAINEIKEAINGKPTTASAATPGTATTG